MVDDGKALANAVVNFGAGIVALVLLFGVIIWLAKRVPPYLKAMAEQAALANEVIRSNSQFMGEMSKSNQNVSKALEMMAPIFEKNMTLLEEHDRRAQTIMAEITRISERTKKCSER
jgi:hypothetical protein